MATFMLLLFMLSLQCVLCGFFLLYSFALTMATFMLFRAYLCFQLSRPSVAPDLRFFSALLLLLLAVRHLNAPNVFFIALFFYCYDYILSLLPLLDSAFYSSPARLSLSVCVCARARTRALAHSLARSLPRSLALLLLLLLLLTLLLPSPLHSSLYGCSFLS